MSLRQKLYKGKQNKENKEVALWINDKLNKLAASATEDGKVWRSAYTEAEVKGKEVVKQSMEEAGLFVYEDAVGNIFGRFEGQLDDVILVGSHIDTVKDGGKFDGALGVMVGIAAVKTLIESGFKPKKTIEVVGLLEEEGSRFPSAYIGSKAINGKLIEEDLQELSEDGILLGDAMKLAGYNPDNFKAAKRNNIKAYIELHIEQGPVLWKREIPVGIVENIVGIKTFQIDIEGQQNHAGTTPMIMRKDPVVAISGLIVALTKKVRELSNTATLTFGRVETFPGMSNVIAQKASVTIDLRDKEYLVMQKMEAELDNILKNFMEDGFNIEKLPQCNEAPVSLNQQMVNIIDKAAKKENIECLHMDSGAGHDAQIFAENVATGMIFIPSEEGISHNPKEFSKLEDIENGYIVLVESLKLLAEEVEVNE